MAHFHIDYSANLEDRIDIAGLCRVVRDAALETGIFPIAGVRVRALRADYVIMADGNPNHAYLDLSVRLRGGRSPQAKTRATAHIFVAIEAYCAKALEESSLMLSMEMRDIDPDLSPKTSSSRRFLSEGLR